MTKHTASVAVEQMQIDQCNTTPLLPALEKDVAFQKEYLCIDPVSSGFSMYTNCHHHMSHSPLRQHLQTLL